MNEQVNPSMTASTKFFHKKSFYLTMKTYAALGSFMKIGAFLNGIVTEKSCLLTNNPFWSMENYRSLYVPH